MHDFFKKSADSFRFLLILPGALKEEDLDKLLEEHGVEAELGFFEMIIPDLAEAGPVIKVEIEDPRP